MTERVSQARSAAEHWTFPIYQTDPEVGRRGIDVDDVSILARL